MFKPCPRHNVAKHCFQENFLQNNFLVRTEVKAERNTMYEKMLLKGKVKQFQIYMTKEIIKMEEISVKLLILYDWKVTIIIFMFEDKSKINLIM